MKKSLPILILIAFATYFLLFGQKKSAGTLAPDFSAELIDGSAFQLSDLQGKYVLLDFWGSWCAPCRRDNPNLVSLHNTFHGKNFKDADGFEIVTVALEKNERYWEKAAKKDGFIWKHQIVRTAKVVFADKLALKYKVTDIPAKFLISPSGEIIGVNMTKAEITDHLMVQLED